MKTKLSILGVALIAGGTLFAQPRVSVGIGFGGYAPGYGAPPAYQQHYVPPRPGPGYEWVDGYWSPQRTWITGYWRAPHYGAPRYVAPRSYDRGVGVRFDFRGGDRHDDHGRSDDHGHRR